MSDWGAAGDEVGWVVRTYISVGNGNDLIQQVRYDGHDPLFFLSIHFNNINNVEGLCFSLSHFSFSRIAESLGAGVMMVTCKPTQNSMILVCTYICT